jgi:hypothetical protein
MKDEGRQLSRLIISHSSNIHCRIGRIRRIGLTATLLLIAACGGVPNVTVTAMPDGGPLSRVDDSLFARTIQSSLGPNGAISYTRLRSDSDLTEYLREIARIHTDAFTSRWQELAFWINAHNAYVLDMIRSNPNAHSISDIGGFRVAKVALIGGEMYSLDGIEHEVLTRRFREPRVFFALYDGSKSSPSLRKEPYFESKISEQLDDQLHEFLADSTKNLLDKHSNTLYLSQTFRDYADDIEKVTGTLLDFVKAFAPPSMASWIGGHPSLNISYLSYDYSLNTSDIEPPHEQPAPRKQPRKPSGGIR